jgi:protein O-mannosyl-transferase
MALPLSYNPRNLRQRWKEAVSSARKGLAWPPASWQLVLLLVAVTIAVYYPVHGFQFVNYDDNFVITDNYHVKYGLDWQQVKWAFTTFYFATWQPVAWLSHALVCQIFGLNPGWHHNINVLLHMLSAVALFWVLLRATGYRVRSFFVAALFAQHPMNVESVAWVAEQRTALSMLFLLLALGAYHWYACAPRAGRYLLVALLFALGLMAKPQVITFPFILLLWDYWPLQRMFAPEKPSSRGGPIVPGRSFFRLVVEKLPLFALAAASGVLTMKAEGAGGVINRQVLLSLRLENAIVCYARYLGKAFWPTRLANLYPYPLTFYRMWQVLAAGLLLLGITIVVAMAHRRRYLLTGWLWFLGTLVPMIGLVPVGRHAMADRYAYLPFVGLFIIICWGVPDFYITSTAHHGSEQSRRSTAWLAFSGGVVLLVLALVARRQVGYWKDSVTLWSHALQVTTGNYQAEDNLASALEARGRDEEALPHLQRAEAIYPSYPFIRFHMGYCEQQMGNLPAAIDDYKKVIELTDSDVLHNVEVRRNAFNNMATAYHDLGNIGQAWANKEAADALRRYTF